MNVDLIIIALIFYLVGMFMGYVGFIFLRRNDGTIYIDETEEKDVVRIELDDLDMLKRRKLFVLRTKINSQK